MIATVLVTVLAAIQQAPLGVTGLRVEYLTNPLGIDATKPRLSWRITSGERVVMECCDVGRAEAREAIERAQGSWSAANLASDCPRCILEPLRCVEPRGAPPCEASAPS